MNWKELFTLNTKKVIYVILAWVLSVLLHNIISGLFGIEEAIFFTLAFPIIPLYLIISIVYSIFRLVNKPKKSKKKRR